MTVTVDTILRHIEAFASPDITAARAAELSVELNNLLEKAVPLIERYRYLYADPFAFLSDLETQACPDMAGELQQSLKDQR